MDIVRGRIATATSHQRSAADTEEQQRAATQRPQERVIGARGFRRRSGLADGRRRLSDIVSGLLTRGGGRGRGNGRLRRGNGRGPIGCGSRGRYALGALSRTFGPGRWTLGHTLRLDSGASLGDALVDRRRLLHHRLARRE